MKGREPGCLPDRRGRPAWLGHSAPPSLAVGADDGYVGAHVVVQWYQRDLRIFANLSAIAQPGDRILLSIGQGAYPHSQGTGPVPPPDATGGAARVSALSPHGPVVQTRACRSS
jgi:Family of unknown function (DUF5694)